MAICTDSIGLSNLSYKFSQTHVKRNLKTGIDIILILDSSIYLETPQASTGSVQSFKLLSSWTFAGLLATLKDWG